MSSASKSSAPDRMPVIFIGHGSPMNAVRDTPFTRKLGELGKRLPRPKAVLCISAHWMTEGTWVTHMQNPKTIHDFYGFPQELFDIQYPAPGDPGTAERISRNSSDPSIHPDNELWGLDHGTWSVLRHMYPAADVPVLQLSLNIIQGPEFHFALGKKLAHLRDEGILIVGSGNIVHNLSADQFLRRRAALRLGNRVRCLGEAAPRRPGLQRHRSRRATVSGGQAQHPHAGSLVSLPLYSRRGG